MNLLLRVTSPQTAPLNGHARSRGPRFIVFALLVLTLMSLVTGGQTRPEKRAGTISGRVLGENGQGIEGVAVSCASLDEGSVNRSVLTDAEGQFAFSGLPPSVYRITASYAGYVVETSGQTDRVARIGDTVTLNLAKGGVITGRVTDSTGAPVVAVFVSAYRIKDSDGRPSRLVSPRSRQTDDRGIYRIYGLTAGSYHVVANSGEYRSGLATAYDLDVPTYHPSSGRDGAAEVMVQQGMEVTSVDIRYRDARGHTISGTVDAGSQTNSNEFGISVRARSAGNLMNLASANSRLVEGVWVFTLSVEDGDYEIVAIGNTFNSSTFETYTGPTRRVTVRGSDVPGVRLAIAPGASITGKVAIEAGAVRPENCPPAGPASLTETLIKTQRDERTSAPDIYESISQSRFAVSEKGEFVLRNLRAGPYRFLADIQTDYWYVRAITVPAATGNRTTDLGRSPLLTRPGDKISNLTMILGEGAASFRGKLSAMRSRAGLWKIHLVPVETDQADNALLHYEAASAPDGAFAFANIAPGRYWIVARRVLENEAMGMPVRPVAWDATERTKLRREAETTNTVVALKSCERVKDYVLE